jgi:hypothetical protein
MPTQALIDTFAEPDIVTVRIFQTAQDIDESLSGSSIGVGKKKTTCRRLRRGARLWFAVFAKIFKKMVC